MGGSISFYCGSVVVTCSRMLETHPSITEQDSPRWTRIGWTFQVERKHVQRHRGQRKKLAKGLQVLVKYA